MGYSSKKYINQVNEKVFEYDNWRFYTNQKVIQDLKSDKVYPIETTELVKQPHSILVQEKYGYWYEINEKFCW